jgi:hypothetical protein
MTDTTAMEQRVVRAARTRFGQTRRLQADFEHGQWWVTLLGSGAQYSVVECQSADGIDYLDFEQVTAGDEDER